MQPPPLTTKCSVPSLVAGYLNHGISVVGVDLAGEEPDLDPGEEFQAMAGLFREVHQAVQIECVGVLPVQIKLQALAVGDRLDPLLRLEDNRRVAAVPAQKTASMGLGSFGESGFNSKERIFIWKRPASDRASIARWSRCLPT